jgi:hypothetical protein
VLLFLRRPEIERRVENYLQYFPRRGKIQVLNDLPWFNQNMLSMIPSAENRSVRPGGLPDIRDETPSAIFVHFCEPKARKSLSGKIRKRLTG